MMLQTFLTVVLGGIMAGCAATSSPTMNDSSQTATGEATALSTAEAQVLALQEERQQLLATLGQFHERIRDLESKLADRDGKAIAKSYDELLAIKEAELAELRKSSAEHRAVAAQRDAVVTDLAQAKRRIEFLEQQTAKKDQELLSIAGLKAAAAELDVAKHRVRELEAIAMQRDVETRALRGVAAERESLATQLQTATVTLNRTKERLAQV
ncbi:MAG TPA: hypothetical protein VFQ06_01995, partial [Nitrospira sp.]|nr:hypothetical protein [Nitrospira sp.]